MVSSDSWQLKLLRIISFYFVSTTVDNKSFCLQVVLICGVRPVYITIFTEIIPFVFTREFFVLAFINLSLQTWPLVPRPRGMKLRNE